MPDPIEFVAGERIVQPVLFKVGEIIPSIAGATVSATVHGASGAVVETLTEGDGIEVENTLPSSTDAHVVFTVLEAVAADLPLGKIAQVRLFVTKAGIVFAFEHLWLKRLA